MWVKVDSIALLLDRSAILPHLTHHIQHACLPCKINATTLYCTCRRKHALLTSRYGTANLPYLSTSSCLLGLPLTVVCCTKGISRATSFSLTTYTHVVSDPVTSGMHMWAPKPNVVRVHGRCRLQASNAYSPSMRPRRYHYQAHVW